MDKKVKIGIIVAVVIVAIIAIVALLFGVLNNVKNADEYKIGDDTIPSIKAVLGERNVNRTSSSYSDGVTEKRFTYTNVEDANSDVYYYVLHLLENNNFYTTSDYDFTGTSGSIQIGAESVDEGQIILIDIEYDLGIYGLTITKGEGTLTLY